VRIAILTGGGDVPGLNPCIKSVVEAAVDRGWVVVGLLRGWAGVLGIDPERVRSGSPEGVVMLDENRVRGIEREGGTTAAIARSTCGRCSTRTASTRSSRSAATAR
jgi:ATP-dependent phosphofructokinase / diphosphate-dependent phosphofructokinase